VQALTGRTADAVVLPYWLDRPASEALAIAREADRLGARELWIGEMATFDAFALGAAIARETSRIALGGRPARLALGASSPAIVAGWHGRPYARLPELAHETLAALRPLLRGERAENGFKLRVALPAPELTLAAFGPRMLAVAAREADRVVLNLVTPAAVREVRSALEREARAAGRACPRLAVWVAAAHEPSSDGIAQLARQVCIYLAPPGYGEMFRAAGFGALVDRARAGEPQRQLARELPRALLEAVAMLGDERTLRSRVSDYRAAGADEVAIVPVTAGDEAGARVLAALAPAP
jgi:probable F420-dependent oxidoreductase